MQPQKSNVPNQLKGLRIWIPMLIGIAVSAYLLISNMGEVRFVEVRDGEYGTHNWVDNNGNGEIEHWDAQEFVSSKKGKYRQQKISDILQEITWNVETLIFMVLAMLMILLRDIGYIIRIRLLTEKKLTWYRSFIVIMMWEFASALTPGVVGGAAVAMFILNREKIALGRATAIVVVTAFLDNMFFVLFVPLILFFVGQEVLFADMNAVNAGALTNLFWGGYAIILFVTLLLFLNIFYFPQLLKKLLTLLSKLPIISRFKERMIQLGDEVIIASKEFRFKPKSFWIPVFFSTVLSWTGRYLVINMILAAFLSIGIGNHLIVLAKQFVLWVVMLISPTPGASGVAEWGFTQMLGGFSTSALLISSLAILWRLVSYFPYLFIGSMLMPRWLKNKKTD